MKAAIVHVSSLVRLFAFVCVAIGAGCGGDDERPQTPPPSGGGGGGGGPVVQVTGGERFAWSQTAPNRQAVLQYRFFAHVDGRRSPLANAQCPSGSGTVFDCSAPLPPMSPGNHMLVLSAMDGAGNESETSQPLWLNVGNRSTTSETIPAATSPTSLSSRACFGAASLRNCYDVEVAAAGLDRPSDLVALDDDRVIFIEGRSRLIVLDRNGLTEAYRVPPDSRSTLESIARDADFDTSRHIYAGVATTHHEGRRLSIVRFREVAGTIGEAATIVPDILIPPIGDATVSVGLDHHLYVALPDVDMTDDDGSGAVLRFDLSGAAKGLNIASPLVSRSNPRPTRLAWNGGQLWLAGLPGSHPALARIDTGSDSLPHLLRPAVVDARLPIETAMGVRDLASLPASADEHTSSLLLLLENPRRIVRLIVEGSAQSAADLHVGEIVPEAVTASRTGDLYVAGVPDGSDTSVLLRLRRLNGASNERE